MSSVPLVVISTPSRHPANQKGYNTLLHGYNSDYINPSFWEITLSIFFPEIGEIEEGQLGIPPEVKSIEWNVKQKQGTFEKTLTKKASTSMFHTKVQVPAQGEYEITLQVKNKDESLHRVVRNFRLRDLLIVSIGDSFASGEGNPDVPAVPSEDQKLFCKTTTPTLAFQKLKSFVGQYVPTLKDIGIPINEIAGRLPLAGNALSLGVSNAIQAAVFMKSATMQLAHVAIDFARTAEGVIVEGIEEVAGIFGLGDGGEDIDPHPAIWQEPLAHRSYRSGHSLAAGQIENQNAFGADRVTFLTFARSGSDITDGLLGGRIIDPELLSNVDGIAESILSEIDTWADKKGQVNEAQNAVANRPIDALMVTIGINTLGFSTLVRRTILKASGQKRKERIAGIRRKINEDLPAEFDQLKVAIDTKLNPKKVFITEYPVNVFKDIADGKKPCGVLQTTIPVPISPALPGGLLLVGLDLDKTEAHELGVVGDELNAKIREKANEFGWIMIDGIKDGFEGHGYCSGNSFFVSAEESCRDQGDFDGMLHPNKKGHSITRDCIVKTLQQELISKEEKGDNWLEPILHIMMR